MTKFDIHQEMSDEALAAHINGIMAKIPLRRAVLGNVEFVSDGDGNVTRIPVEENRKAVVDFSTGYIMRQADGSSE